jgi:hypothetical protein
VVTRSAKFRMSAMLYSMMISFLSFPITRRQVINITDKIYP